MTLNDTTQSGVLYHVTVDSCIDSIRDNGVSPSYSVTEFKASWFVTYENILWAILHVADRHDCKLDSIFVCTVTIQWGAMRRTNSPGRYYTKHTFEIDSVSPARWFVDGSTK